jgi:hypothetical protein
MDGRVKRKNVQWMSSTAYRFYKEHSPLPMKEWPFLPSVTPDHIYMEIRGMISKHPILDTLNWRHLDTQK